MNIRLDDLRKAIDLVMAHITETRGLSEIEVDPTLYWDIPAAQRYSMESDPTVDKLEVGSFPDSLEVVRGLVDKTNEPLAYMLEELAPLLRLVGERAGTQLAPKGG